MKKPLKSIPSFGLYGEARAGADLQHLHIEEIRARSQRYHWEIGPHRHATLAQCVFVAEGPATIRLEDEQHALSGPALAILPPATVHAFAFSSATEGFVLSLSPEALLGGDSGAHAAAWRSLLAQPRLLTLGADPQLPERLRRQFGQLHEEFRHPDSADSPVCAWLARAVLWTVSVAVQRRHHLPAQALRQSDHFSRFRALLERQYPRHWRVAHYARALGLSAGRLNRLCMAQCGQSAFELIQERLALEARRRLTYVALPIAQIARDLGFRDPAYFCRFFRRRTRLSPRHFRERALR